MSALPAADVADAPRPSGAECEDDRLLPPLLPGLSPWVRADGSVQLGHDPVHGVVLTGLAGGEAAAAIRLIRGLGGASGPVLSSTLARATGLPLDRLLQIVRTLDDAGLTAPHYPAPGGGDLSAWSLSRRRHGTERGLALGSPLPVRDRRAGARVVVDGRGALVVEVARLLRAAQVGEVRSGWYAGAAGELAGDGPDPSLVISVGSRLPRVRARDWLPRGIAHLPVVARWASVDIGPLVVPGTGPCVSCVRLGEGTSLAADDDDDPLADAQDDPAPVEPTLAGVAAGALAMLALGVIDAYPPPVGIRWHTALPLPSLATSRWRIHPACREPGHPTTPAPPRPGR